MHAVHALRLVPLVEVLQLDFELVQCVGIEQLAQFGLAEELAELRLIDGQRLRTALGERRVAVVDVVRHVAEQQRACERRRLLRVGDDDADDALADFAHRRHQRADVEHVAQAFAVGLEDHRERAEARCDLQQVIRALALHPQRHAAVGTMARQQQRARSRLAELRREHRRRAELPHDQLFDFVRIGRGQLRARRRVGVGEADDEAVVGPHRLHVDAQLVAHFRRDGHGPRRVNAPAERREHADAPVAEVVENALDDDSAVVGDRAGGVALVLQVLQEIFRRELVEVVLFGQPLHRFGRFHRGDLAHQPADALAEGNRSFRGVGLPERHLPRLARGGRDQHAIVRDLLDAPRRRAEEERLADARLEDHLLIQLADARAPLLRAGQKNAEQPAVGNGPAAGDGHVLRAGARGDRVRDAVPGDARAQLGEFVGRVEAGEHVQDAVERGARQLRERRGSADRGEQLVRVPRLDRDHGHDLLRHDVERIARIPRRLDIPSMHGLGHGGAGN